MVGFFGFGEPGFGVSLGFGYGNIGWVPLAPFERFRPWYGRGFAGRNLAVVNNTNIASVYRNARFSGAVIGLRAADFGRAGVGRSSFVRPGAGELSRAGMVSSGMPLAPARSFNSTRSPNVVRLGNATPGSNSGGWRRLDSQPGASPVGGNRSDVRSFSSPVRISPTIVNNRSGSPANFRSPNNSFGGFGGSRPASQGAPTAPRDYGGGGGYRGGPPSGGAQRGGGGAPHGNGGGPHH